MRHRLDERQKRHLARLGIALDFEHLDVEDAEYQQHYADWKITLPRAAHEILHMKVLGHAAWKQHAQHIAESERVKAQTISHKHEHRHKLPLWVIGILVLLLIVPRAHCQFSKASYDACDTNVKIPLPISLTANTKLITGTAAKKIYICAINIVSAAADNVALVEGTGSTCGTNTTGIAGGATAATGWNFAANGGLTQGDGKGTVMSEATAADDLCLLVSGATQVSGHIQYVVQ